MPSVLAHCLCGEDAVSSCNSLILKKMVRGNEDIFCLGCQGPDPFMFYHHFPFQSRDRIEAVRKCSSLIHKNRINDFFAALLNYAREEEDEQLFVYIAGFLAHHALDSIAHPYVFYQTGSVYKNTIRLHQILENQIDLAILKLKKIKPENYRADRKIVKLKDSVLKIAEMMVHSIREIFNHEVAAEEVKESYDDMARIEKVLTDPKGNKLKLFKILERLTKKPNPAVSMMLPSKYDEKLDAMNNSRKLWHSPCDMNEESQETFKELYDKAVRQTKEVFDLLGRYIKKEVDVQPILEIVANRNYDSGRNDGLPMKYFRMDLGIGNYKIRSMEFDDLQQVCDIYQKARDFMRETGNTEQWKDDHPAVDLIKKDIENKTGYVIELDDEIVGVFALILGEDVTYKYIEGKWLNNFPYGTIHRIASKQKVKGILRAAVSYGSRYTNNIRIDTHKDNKVMQHLLEKLQFRKCGIIYLLNGDPRIAYQLEVG
ncbi:MAG TPA: zinc dependent phospholipase C family protein [Erysipelotrichaceae bacterium]|nr:zinc dependent phospholipase C family protein [Erysipelotrichaceae bacterium]HQB31911.1 zinc dependent phospholipase C family protein [Erysipelotrichaceae bacterium]